MALITLSLPGLLAGLIGTKRIKMDADTPHDALQQAIYRYPALNFLLLDESGHLREHVLLFHNEENTRWSSDGLQRPLRQNDHLTILQAVAGG